MIDFACKQTPHGGDPDGKLIDQHIAIDASAVAAPTRRRQTAPKAHGLSTRISG
jgi:hypothetical protein